MGDEGQATHRCPRHSRSYAPRFGLYTVNILTDPRLIRHATGAVATYHKLIRNRGVPSDFQPAERPMLANCSTASVAPQDRATCVAAATGT